MSAAAAAELHRQSIVIDATCPLLNDERYLPWWIEGGVTAAAPSVGGDKGARGSLDSLATWIKRIEQNPGLLLVKSAADIERAKQEDRFGIIFHFQGTEPVEDNVDLVWAYKALGVGMIQLSYNVKNRVGDGCEERTDCGLSRFGLRLIETMNAARVIVDCSHTGYRTTMEAIEASTAPTVFSHANAKGVHPSPRNITDEQARAIAATNGLIGAVGFPAFVADSPRPSLDQFIDHIVYFGNLIGIDHVGLGIDYFNGQVPVANPDEISTWYDAIIASGRWTPQAYPPPPYHYPDGLDTPRGFPNLTARLSERGFSDDEVKKIVGGNWVRVFRDVWGN